MIEKVKQPEYLLQSIQFAQRAQEGIQDTVKTVQDLHHLDTSEYSLYLPPISILSLLRICNSDSYSLIIEMTSSQIENMEQVQREEFLEETLEAYEKLENLWRTIFIILYKSNKPLLDNYLQKNPKKETTLHYDLDKENGFDLDFYCLRADSLKDDIRLKAFKKIFVTKSTPDNLDEAKHTYDTVILPKANELISLIDPVFTETDLYINKLIAYGFEMIDKDELIESIKKTLNLLHKLSILYYCSTLEEALEEYTHLQKLNEKEPAVTN
ncbi:hypothetical protein [Bacillus wiedmannii]|uniref:hypothetical protein n=1 Tax=Bacillus wiedmannii TaxID=1890302 RepID=UPI000BFE0847|nr:hypothetical protein [Bacillus wiedmannii]PHF04935.1 hypothetical protein COF74_27385 [Bacillus wiedmannii]